MTGAPGCCCMTFGQVTSPELNEIHHHDSHYVLNLYSLSAHAAFDCHCLRTFYSRACLYSIVAKWALVSSVAFQASKECGSVNWGSHSQSLWTAAQPNLHFDFARFISFFSGKLSPLNMVPTQRTYGNILRIRKTDAFVWAKLILKKNFLKFVFTDVHCWPLTLNSIWL